MLPSLAGGCVTVTGQMMRSNVSVAVQLLCSSATTTPLAGAVTCPEAHDGPKLPVTLAFVKRQPGVSV